MAFSHAYLKTCSDRRRCWSAKGTQLGDWYVHLKHGVDVVSNEDLERVKFSSPDIVYVPDTDDLLDMIDNQIAAWGEDPSEKKLTIACDAKGIWSVEVHFAGRIVQSTQAESIHMALLGAVGQMVVFKMDPK